MYVIENGLVYNEYTQGNAEIKAFVGMEKQMLVTETETEIILQWQKFNLTDGQYENDSTNTDLFEYDGKTYSPISGTYTIIK